MTTDFAADHGELLLADDHALILDAESRRQAALIAVDMMALDRLFADDLVHVHGSAVVHDKAGILAYIQSRRAFRAIERGPLTVRVFGEAAVITGRMTNHLTHDGHPAVLSGMVTQVLRREAGDWRFVSFQFTMDKEI